MAVIQKAIAVAWGTGAGFTCTAVAALKAVLPLSSKQDRSAQMVEIPNLNGEAIGLVFWNQVDEIELEVFPSAATLALAITAAGTMGINPGDKILLANTDDPDQATTFVCMKVGKARKTNDYVRFNLSAKKYPTDLSTTISV